MPRHSNPVIQQIDSAFDELDDDFGSFCQTHAYEFRKSEDGAFNPPRRTLMKKGSCPDVLWNSIGLIVENSYDERIRDGFYPGIPCTLYASASINHDGTDYALRHDIATGKPFTEVAESLPRLLQLAHEFLSQCTNQNVLTDGISADPKT